MHSRGDPMRNILIAFDLDLESENVLVRAIEISRLSGATLHVVHIARRVQGPGADNTAWLRDEIRDRVRAFIVKHAGPSKVDFVVHLEMHGRVSEQIIQYAGTLSADLVVIGRSVRPDVLPGSVFLTTGQILAGSPAPVLVVTQPASRSYQQILLEADLSTSTADILPLARLLGAESRLRLLVKTDTALIGAGLLGRLFSRLQRRRKEKFVDRVMLPLQEIMSSECEVTIDFISGDTGEELYSKLADDQIDLVGLIHMHDRLRHREMESQFIVALQSATCDVLCRSG